MSKNSSRHKSSKEKPSVSKTESQKADSKNNPDSRVIIIIDDTPPGSPIREKNQVDEDRDKRAKEIQITTSITQGKNNTSNSKKVDEPSRKVIVTAESGSPKKQQQRNNVVTKPRKSSKSPVTRWRDADRHIDSPGYITKGNNSDYRAGDRDLYAYKRYSRSPSVYRPHTRSPSPLYRRSSSPYYPNRSPSPIYRRHYRRISRSPSTNYRRISRSPSPHYRRISRSPSPRYRRRSRSPTPLYHHRKISSHLRRISRSPSSRYRYGRSPSPRYKSRSPSAPYRRPRSSDSPPQRYKRPRLPSPFFTHRLPSPKHRDHSPVTRSPSRSEKESKNKALDKQDQQRSTIKATTNKHITSVKTGDEASKKNTGTQVSSMRILQPESNHSPSAANISPSESQKPMYSHVVPDYVSIIKGAGDTPVPIAEKSKHAKQGPSIAHEAPHLISQGEQTDLINHTLTDTQINQGRESGIVDKDISIKPISEVCQSAIAGIENPAAVEKHTLKAVEPLKTVLTETINPVVAEKPQPVISNTNKPVEYGIQPSLKNNNSNGGSVIVTPDLLQSEPTHSTTNGLGFIRKKPTRLLAPWKVKMSDEGDIFYYNPITGETSVTRPV